MYIYCVLITTCWHQVAPKIRWFCICFSPVDNWFGLDFVTIESSILNSCTCCKTVWWVSSWVLILRNTKLEMYKVMLNSRDDVRTALGWFCGLVPRWWGWTSSAYNGHRIAWSVSGFCFDTATHTAHWPLTVTVHVCFTTILSLSHDRTSLNHFDCLFVSIISVFF